MDRIAPINGLRGLAILSLLFSNITHDLFLSGPFLPKGNLSPGALISSTWSGVDLLFILSGFVLFAPYAGGRRALTSGDALWQFYRHRLLRLMPLYYLALAIDLFVKPKPWPEALWLASGVFDIHPASTQHLFQLAAVAARHHHHLQPDLSRIGLAVVSIGAMAAGADRRDCGFSDTDHRLFRDRRPLHLRDTGNRLPIRLKQAAQLGREGGGCAGRRLG